MIVVIAILAAISIVAYNGVQDRAYDSSVKGDLNSMYKQLNVQAAESGAYELPDASNQITLSKSAYSTDINNVFICINRSENRIALTATSKSGKNFKIVEGAMSSNSGPYYAASTCSLVNVTDTSGNYQRGWTTGSPNGSWAGWTK